MDILIAAFPEVEKIGRRVASLVKADYTTIDVRNFPDGEFHIALKKNPGKKKVVIISSIAKSPDEKIIESILVGGIAKDYGAREVVLVATYLPYMRQDKHFEEYDSFSAKHVAKLFREFDEIIAIDPHLHRIHSLKELYKGASSISANPLIADYIRKKYRDDFIIVGPDEESVQWSQKIANLLGKRVQILKKTRLGDRNVKTKKADLGSCKNIIIIDDIISTGRTIENAIRMAREQGAKNIVVIGIHGVFVGNAAMLIKKHRADLVTTNTIENPYAEIDVSPLIAESLKKLK